MLFLILHKSEMVNKIVDSTVSPKLLFEIFTSFYNQKKRNNSDFALLLINRRSFPANKLNFQATHSIISGKILIPVSFNASAITVRSNFGEIDDFLGNMTINLTVP